MSPLEKGRPQNENGRLDKEIRCYDLLDSLGIAYERIDHPAADTMDVCTAIDQALGAMICKNLFLCNRQQTTFYLLMIPADKVFKTKDLSHQLGVARLSFAGADHMEELLDITPGSVSLLGLMNDTQNRVQLLVDEEVLQDKWLGCHPCINTSSLKLRTADAFGPLLQAMHHTMTVVKLERPTPEGTA